MIMVVMVGPCLSLGTVSILILHRYSEVPFNCQVKWDVVLLYASTASPCAWVASWSAFY